MLLLLNDKVFGLDSCWGRRANWILIFLLFYFNELIDQRQKQQQQHFRLYKLGISLRIYCCTSWDEAIIIKVTSLALFDGSSSRSMRKCHVWRDVLRTFIDALCFSSHALSPRDVFDVTTSREFLSLHETNSRWLEVHSTIWRALHVNFRIN